MDKATTRSEIFMDEIADAMIEDRRKLVWKVLEPVGRIASQDDADEFFSDLVAFRMKASPKVSREDVEQGCREDIGFYAAFLGHEARLRIEKLFSTKHPIFGSAILTGEISINVALDKGMWIGAKHAYAQVEKLMTEIDIDDTMRSSEDPQSS